MEKRKTLLTGVCITGGEPLLSNDLDVVIKKIQSLGLKVKIDTNGTLPERLKILKPDYIAMDIKTSIEKYYTLCDKKIANLEDSIKESINYIINSGIDHEFRTTVVPDLVTPSDIKKIVDLIKGCKKYVLAQFRPEHLLNKDWQNITPYPKEIFDQMKQIIENAGIYCELRINY